MLKKQQTKKATTKTTQQKPNLIKRTLASWVWRTPIKFAALVLFLSIFISLVYGAIATALGLSMSGKTIVILATIINLFGIYKMIKWLRTDVLDRRSFVAILTGAAIATCFAMAALTLLIIFVMPVASMAPYAVSGKQLIFALTGLIIMALIATYIMGLLAVWMYACYLRSIGLGLSRIKALLTLPFCIMWVPGYIMNDAKKTDSHVEIRSRIFAALTDWIIARPCNSYIALALLCITETLCLVGSAISWNLIIVLAPIALFLVWRIFVSNDKLRKTIGGTFATVAVLINIITLAFVLTIGATTKPQMTQQNTEVIDITDTITK